MSAGPESWSQPMSVVPLRFVGAIKDMKAMLHNVQGEGRWRGRSGMVVRDG